AGVARAHPRRVSARARSRDGGPAPSGQDTSVPEGSDTLWRRRPGRSDRPMGTTLPVSGSPRTARVLDPSFVEHLEGSSLAEVRRRRDEALAEREFQSYLRRLVQVRQDILRSERERRATGAVQAPLVERLTSVLATGPTGTGRGEALRVTITDEDIVEAERRVDGLLEEVDLFHPEGVDDAHLA